MNQTIKDLGNLCVVLDHKIHEEIVKANSLITVEYYNELRESYMDEQMKKLGYCTKQQCVDESFDTYIECAYNSVFQAASDVREELEALDGL